MTLILDNFDDITLNHNRSQGRAHQMRIKTNPEKTQYFLVPSKKFDSLYSLISHYRRNPFETRVKIVR